MTSTRTAASSGAPGTGQAGMFRRPSTMPAYYRGMPAVVLMAAFRHPWLRGEIRPRRPFHAGPGVAA
jgi:hypothetical protein